MPCNPSGESPPKKPVFFRRRDIWLVGVVLLAGCVLLAFGLWRRPGTVAVVTVVGQDEPVATLRLDEPGTYHIDAALPVTLRVADGAVRFEDSVCPDHDCEEFGWLRREGDVAICMPAGVTVLVQQPA